MNRLTLILGAAASVALTLGPDIATARPHHYYHHAYRSCAQQHRRSANIGAVAGAIGGGIIGGALTHGRGAPILLGAGAGALAGHEIGRHADRC